LLVDDMVDSHEATFWVVFAKFGCEQAFVLFWPFCIQLDDLVLFDINSE
jgi:hypothetical protein